MAPGLPGEEIYPMEEQNKNAQRTECEVYSRVSGYLRPVSQWNDAKQAEFDNRKMFTPECNEC